jgi:hypothetical protein
VVYLNFSRVRQRIRVITTNPIADFGIFDTVATWSVRTLGKYVFCHVCVLDHDTRFVGTLRFSIRLWTVWFLDASGLPVSAVMFAYDVNFTPTTFHIFVGVVSRSVAVIESVKLAVIQVVIF